MSVLRYLFFALLALFGLRRTKRERIIPEAPADRRAETALIVLLLAAAACAIGFVFVYATTSIHDQTQFLGLSLGLCFAFLAAAGILISKRLVVTEELEEEYPDDHPDEQEEVSQLVSESGSRFTRKRLLRGVAALTGGSLGAALLSPVASLGPGLETRDLYATPWRRGVRLVDENGTPYLASDIESDTFYSAYPERTNHDLIGSPLIVVRLNPQSLELPPARATWAPDGIVAYSKICTHAGCAIALYRKPLFPPLEPKPAFVCPCHYSTFDPAAGGKVLFGPAGRALPQLPLMVDTAGALRAAGNFSGPVGPSWWGVRLGRPYFSR